MAFRVGIALLVVLIILLLLGGNLNIEAAPPDAVPETTTFTPPNVRHHPGFPQNMPMTVKVGQTATMTWEAVDSYGWAAWRDVVSRSIDTDSSDAQSLGRVLNDFLRSEGRGQITIREARSGESPDLRHFAVSTAFLEAKCGTWATACIYGGVPLTVPAYYKAASMITWGYASQAPVVRHETHHTLARACDQYQGGCPRASDGTYASAVVCTGNPDTLMDCGGAARTATRFDYDTFVLAYPANTPFLQQVPACVPTDYFADWGNGVKARWNPCTDPPMWEGTNGYSYIPSTGVWLDNGIAWSPCTAWGGRDSNAGFSDHGGASTFLHALGRWFTAPSC
jgi:hypothetical protein